MTGSARLDAYNSSGDSLMGRYFRYRIHPLSVAELLKETIIENELREPVHLDDEKFRALYLWRIS